LTVFQQHSIAESLNQRSASSASPVTRAPNLEQPDSAAGLLPVSTASEAATGVLSPIGGENMVEGIVARSPIADSLNQRSASSASPVTRAPNLEQPDSAAVLLPVSSASEAATGVLSPIVGETTPPTNLIQKLQLATEVAGKNALPGEDKLPTSRQQRERHSTQENFLRYTRGLDTRVHCYQILEQFRHMSTPEDVIKFMEDIVDIDTEIAAEMGDYFETVKAWFENCAKGRVEAPSKVHRKIQTKKRKDMNPRRKKRKIGGPNNPPPSTEPDTELHLLFSSESLCERATQLADSVYKRIARHQQKGMGSTIGVTEFNLSMDTKGALVVGAMGARKLLKAAESTNDTVIWHMVGCGYMHELLVAASLMILYNNECSSARPVKFKICGFDNAEGVVTLMKKILPNLCAELWQGMQYEPGCVEITYDNVCCMQETLQGHLITNTIMAFPFITYSLLACVCSSAQVDNDDSYVLLDYVQVENIEEKDTLLKRNRNQQGVAGRKITKLRNSPIHVALEDQDDDQTRTLYWVRMVDLKSILLMLWTDAGWSEWTQKVPTDLIPANMADLAKLLMTWTIYEMTNSFVEVLNRINQSTQIYFKSTMLGTRVKCVNEDDNDTYAHKISLLLPKEGKGEFPFYADLNVNHILYYLTEDEVLEQEQLENICVGAIIYCGICGTTIKICNFLQHMSSFDSFSAMFDICEAIMLVAIASSVRDIVSRDFMINHSILLFESRVERGLEKRLIFRSVVINGSTYVQKVLTDGEFLEQWITNNLETVTDNTPDDQQKTKRHRRDTSRDTSSDDDDGKDDDADYSSGASDGDDDDDDGEEEEEEEEEEEDNSD
jgi:hypothetical protein